MTSTAACKPVMFGMGARHREAAVAVVVAAGEAGDEVLVARRATVEGDPWSGHIALPGGGREPADRSLEETARRETLEETGIDLSASACVGTLGIVSPHSAGAPRISVAPFVFRYEGDRTVTVSEELVEAWWIPVSDLQRAEAWQVTSVVVRGDVRIEARGFAVGGHVLWGLTERIIDNFLRSWPAPAGTGT